MKNLSIKQKFLNESIYIVAMLDENVIKIWKYIP